jgi:Pyridine nucleotide-disulphide oxidoreductase
MENHDVIIIGAGPSGLAAAIRLRDLGVKDVVVLEREAEAGGVPRHCGHFGFGWESHRRLTTGPKFAAQMMTGAAGIDIRTSHTVLEFTMRKSIRVHSAKGISEMSARRVVLATGTREGTAAGLLIGGNKVSGIMNTGTLQQSVYLKNQKPFSRPAIIGHEWVTYSALMTCRHAGIKPVGIFAAEKLETPWFFPIGAKLRYGVPTDQRTKLIAIHGKRQVGAIEIERRGVRSTVECDGVILSGRFVPELSLLTNTSAPLRPSGTSPARGEDRSYYAPNDLTIIGNADGGVNTAGRCVVNARATVEDIL